MIIIDNTCTNLVENSHFENSAEFFMHSLLLKLCDHKNLKNIALYIHKPNTLLANDNSTFILVLLHLISASTKTPMKKLSMLTRT